MAKYDHLTAKDWEAVDRIVDKGFSIDEAVEMYEADKAIDKGEKLFELSADLEAGAKKARRAERKPNSKSTRKEDTDKTALMTLLMEAVEPIATHPLNRTKPGEFEFMYNDRKFKVVLSAPRS